MGRFAVLQLSGCAGFDVSLLDAEAWLDEYKSVYQAGRPHISQLLPKCHPIDAVVSVDLYLPGCPPTPELFLAALLNPEDPRAGKIVCHECKREKLRDMRPKRLLGFQQGGALPGVCLINQGYLCVGSSTLGGGHLCPLCPV